jgi:hypothetical protein
MTAPAYAMRRAGSHDFNDIPADAMNDEDRRRARARLENNERAVARRAALAQFVAEPTETRRLVDQGR